MVAQRRIEQRHIAHREPGAAQRDGEARVVISRQRQGKVGPRKRQRRGKPARAHRIERRHRRHVER